MEPTFSQRMGFKPLKSIIQVTSMDDTLRTGLWNDLIVYVWRKIIPADKVALGTAIWTEFFNKPIDDLPSAEPNYYHFKPFYAEFQWFEVYDFIEFIVNHLYGTEANLCIYAMNGTLEKHLSAYRFIGKRLVQITSDQEIAEVEVALGVSRQFTQHLDRAVELLSDRSAPDYRNSIKESISAVEAMCKLITGNPKATLGDALRQLENTLGTLHPALRNAFSNLYGYTSDAEGIRHGMLGESDLDIEDAKFMLIACSAFINYLVAKADKAGLQLKQV